MSDDSSFSSSGSETGDSFAEGGGAETKKDDSGSGSESESSDADNSESSSESEPEFQASQDAPGTTDDKIESKVTRVSNAHHDEVLELSMSQSTVNTNADAEGGAPAGAGAGTDHKALKNEPYDEAVEVTSSSDEAPTPAAKNAKAGGAPSGVKDSDDSSASDSSSTDSEDSVPEAAAAASAAKLKPTTLSSLDTGSKPKMANNSDDSDSDSDTTSTDSDSDKPGTTKRKSYANLRVSPEIQELFQYIKHYEPPQMELDTKLKCFIPEYIPSIGNIDPFIKVARPDGKPDELGLSVLDEPHSQQSDSTVLEMQLRATSKKTNLKEMAVACIENAEKDTGRIGRWIEDIQELHRSKPSTGVTYSEPMPDIEHLMQVWPPDFEDMLRALEIPPAELDVSLHEYAQLACNLLDIPVHKSAVQSLHVFFTLYTEFTANQHFITGAADKAKAAMEATGASETGSQRMMLDGDSGSNVWRADDSDSKHSESKSGGREEKDED